MTEFSLCASPCPDPLPGMCFCPVIRAEREAAVRVARLADELAEASGPIWHWGDGHGGYVVSALHQALRAYDLTTESAIRGTKRSAVSQARKEFQSIRQTTYLTLAKRDGEHCRACGSTGLLHVDHKTPLSRGGSNDLDNLHLLCGPCNLRKGARSWDEFMAAAEQ